MNTQAATPSGGAEASAHADVSANKETPSVHDRLKAYLSPEEAPANTPKKPEAKAEQASAPVADTPADEPAEPPEPPAEEVVETAEPEAEEAPEVTDLKSLADATGLELDKLMDLDLPTKIDGKEGKARLRDVLKSYQLEGHLNQGLMKLAEERKAFEGEHVRKSGEIQALVGRVSQAATLAQKILEGEFADVNWQELQRNDPAEFQAKYGAYTMRQDGIRQLNQVVQQESEKQQLQQKAEFESYLSEQQKLLDSKLPEWSDKALKDKDVTEMVATLSEAYGVTEKEIKSLVDHRQILIARDAMRWQKLQKSKPVTVNKVKTAPKLLKPGTQQSRAAQNNFIAQKERERLRSTGKVSDAKAPLKRLLFS
jgi:hypothetical protein